MRSGILCGLVLAAGVRAEIVYSDASGSWDLESRWFPDPALNPGQDSNASSFVANARLYVEDTAGWSFTLEPFLRYDDADPRRLPIHENGSTPSPPLVLMNRDDHAPHSQPLVFRVRAATRGQLGGRYALLDGLFLYSPVTTIRSVSCSAMLSWRDR